MMAGIVEPIGWLNMPMTFTCFEFACEADFDFWLSAALAVEFVTAAGFAFGTDFRFGMWISSC